MNVVMIASCFNVICSFAVSKQRGVNTYLINFELTTCIDGPCETLPILTEVLVAIPPCNINGTFTLPGGSVEEYVNRLPVAGITDSVIDTVLSTLGVKVGEIYFIGVFKI